MERIVETNELSDETLDNVTAGGLLHFVYQIFTAAPASDDDNVKTADANYKVYTS